jgi:copper(I)-binding protein
MKRSAIILLTAALGLFNTAAFAQTDVAALTFDDPWIRGSVPGQKNGAGYLVIDNKSSQAGALVSANSDRAQRIELHTIVREDGVAKMREVQEIPIPANGSVTLQPGGYHVMFIGLTQPFKEGESIPVMLNFSGEQTTEVSFTVKAPTYMGSAGMQGHNHGGGHGGHGMMQGQQ